jgi:hypothetical protein
MMFSVAHYAIIRPVSQATSPPSRDAGMLEAARALPTY